MAEKRDYYEALGVQRGASKDEVKDAYRKLAMQSILIETKMWERKKDSKKSQKLTRSFRMIKKDKLMINLVIQVLIKDINKKTFSEAPTSTLFSETWVLAIFFRTFFGGGGGGFGGVERSNRGQDLAYNLEITLEEAAKGADKEIEIPRTEHCDVCGGSGSGSRHYSYNLPKMWRRKTSPSST